MKQRITLKHLVLFVCALGFIFPSMAMAKDAEIAVVVKITGIPWFNRMEVGVDEAGKSIGVKAYQVGPSEADPAQQVKIVEDLIEDLQSLVRHADFIEVGEYQGPFDFGQDIDLGQVELAAQVASGSAHEGKESLVSHL